MRKLKGFDLKAFLQSNLAAGIFGVIVAAIGTAWLGRWLYSIESLPMLAIIGAAILAACFLTAHWMDKKAAARKEPGRSDHSWPS